MVEGRSGDEQGMAQGYRLEWGGGARVDGR